MDRRPLAIGAAWVGVLFFAVTGAWAFLAPHSFSTALATYPPYNRHLFHDAGAFQLGIAAALLAGLPRPSGPAVGPWGGPVAGPPHAIPHWVDRRPGRPATPPELRNALAAGP